MKLHRDLWNHFESKLKIKKNFSDKNKTSSDVGVGDIGRVVAHAIDLPREKLLNPEDLTQEPHVLRCGHFGAVIRGVYKKPSGENIKVAIKLPHISNVPEKTQRNTLALLEELKILSYVGKHEYIEHLIGTVIINNTVEGKGRVHGVLEMFETSLDEYLRKCSFNSIAESTNKSSGDNTSVPLNQLNTTDLIRWSFQIACGMQHLTSRKIIHRNLTAKNVLLFDKNGRLDVRITDIAVSRKSSKENVSYIMNILNWRYLAPELFATDQSFSEATDVWAFGITLWVIFNLSQQQPYHKYEIFDQRFLLAIQKEHCVNSKPEYAETAIYEIMCKCWNREPSKRPKFTELVSTFLKILPSEYLETVPHSVWEAVH